MRRSHLAVYIGLALAFAVSAAPPLTITDAGYFLTVIGSDDVPTYVEIEDVFDLRTGDGPKDQPPKDDPPTEPEPPPSGISADVAKWSEQVGDPVTAQKYALIFEVVRDGSREEKVNIENLFTVLRLSADDVVGPDWEMFRSELSRHLTAELQESNLSSQEKITGKLELIRYGLAYSARGSDPVSSDDAMAVIVMVNKIIDSAAGQSE